jgi:hypothetical protein
LNYNLLKTCACVFAAAVLIHTTAIAQVVRSATPDSTWNDTVVAPQCQVSVNPATINAGQTSNVTVSTCGSPTNPATQYRWTVTSAGPTATGTGGGYTFPTAGTYCYTVRGASIDGWGKQSPQACVTVNAGGPPPAVCDIYGSGPTVPTPGDYTFVVQSCTGDSGGRQFQNPVDAPALTTASPQFNMFYFPSSGSFTYGVRGNNGTSWSPWVYTTITVGSSTVCPANSTGTSSAACGPGLNGNRNYTTTTTYSAAPACTRSDSTVETSNNCTCANGATNPPECTTFGACTRPSTATCPLGTSIYGLGCYVNGSETYCSGGRLTPTAGFSYYDANMSASGPGACPWQLQSQNPICGNCPSGTPVWDGTNCNACPGTTSWNGSACVSPVVCPATETVTTYPACPIGTTGSLTTTTTTTYGAAPTCTPSASASTSGSCACTNGATNPPECTAFGACTRPSTATCPLGTSIYGLGCYVNGSETYCTGGRITIQSQYNYYLPNLDAPGPATCPWIPQSKALICGGCTNPAHTFNVATQNCEATCNPGAKPPDIPACATCHTDWSSGFPREFCTPLPSGPGAGTIYVLSGDGCSWVAWNYTIIDCANP